MNCPLCKKDDLELLYEVHDVSVFQNKVYDSVESAQKAQTENISLMLCRICGFIFNLHFNASVMNYDKHYQNEQAYSSCFQKYLVSISSLLKSRDFEGKKVIEIGCGKGYFLEKLRENGFNITGFDPAYEGDNPAIVKDYFTKTEVPLHADLIILRHILEHIQTPVDFLHAVAEACGYKGKIFIEVPDFNWIIRNKSFWDIFYEYCNYFTFESLGSLFKNPEQDSLFNGQYMYLLADLDGLQMDARPTQLDCTHHGNIFQTQLEKYRIFVKDRQELLIWGAGAKGVTFVNLVDPDREYISFLVDINPQKQNKYIAKTAHKIIAPGVLSNLQGRDIVVMNDNYLGEIKKDLEKMDFNVYTLGENI